MDNKEKWIKLHELGKMFGVSKTTIWRYSNDMKCKERYKNKVIRTSKVCTLVELNAFKDYLRNRSNKIERMVI